MGRSKSVVHRVQASRLRSKLAEQKIPDEALVESPPPLTRAIDTLMPSPAPSPSAWAPPTQPPTEAEAGPSATSQQLQPFKVVVRRSVSGCILS